MDHLCIGLDYDPLDESKSEIRLLSILLGPESNLIRCTLQHVSCSSAYPEYTALSYCWGNPKHSLPITVNGCMVPVTRNLEAALQELRGSIQIPIWVDALCLNQDDTDERSRQTLGMKDLYLKVALTVA
jgi:hypothetical protein